jgi:hypothetical protein
MNGTVKLSIQCLVAVKDYETKSSGDRGPFVQDFQIVPSVGDIVLLLEPGFGYDQIWCVVEQRIVYSDSVTLCTRLVAEDDRIKMLQYGEVIGP